MATIPTPDDLAAMSLDRSFFARLSRQLAKQPPNPEADST